jgi:hypothetical protein
MHQNMFEHPIMTIVFRKLLIHGLFLSVVSRIVTVAEGVVSARATPKDSPALRAMAHA